MTTQAPEYIILERGSAGFIGWPTKDKDAVKEHLDQILTHHPDRRDDFTIGTFAEWELMGEREYLDRAPVRIKPETYDHMLEVLPPLEWVGNRFCMSEFQTGQITRQFHRLGDLCVAKYVRFRDDSTYITAADFDAVRDQPVADWLGE